MKKIISLIVLLVLMVWTWTLIHSDPSVSFETHSIIQERLAQIIKASVQKNRPSAQSYNLERLWTETVGDGQVKAHFVYTFKEGTGSDLTAQTVRGEALLKKTSHDQTSQQNWKVEKVHTSGNQVAFEEEIITPVEEKTPAAPSGN
jgi:hypothetical protein